MEKFVELKVLIKVNGTVDANNSLKKLIKKIYRSTPDDHSINIWHIYKTELELMEWS